MINQITEKDPDPIPVFTSQPLSPFHELAFEILAGIFSELSKTEQAVLGCVCRKFSCLENDAVLRTHTKLSNSLFSRSLNVIDLESGKSVKMQIKESTITLTNITIHPTFIEKSNKSIFLNADIILCRGKVSFMDVRPKAEYINLAVKAMQYLPENGYMVLYQIPDDTKHTFIYIERGHVKIFTIIGKFIDHLNDKEVKSIQQDRTQIKVEYSKPERWKQHGNRQRY